MAPRIFRFGIVALTVIWMGSARPAVAADAGDVGRVLLAAGDAVAVRGGQAVKLALNAPVREGDVLRTGQSSNLQVRFIDESIISMKESSELRINEFKFSGKADGTERAFYTLAKGGLRTVTGAIGGANPKNYSLATTTATLAVRGTDYSVTLCQQDCRNANGSLAKDGLYGRVLGLSHGTNEIEVKNGRDAKAFGINENFYVADMMSSVDRLLVAPEFVANRLEGRRQAATTQAAGNNNQGGGGNQGGGQQDNQGGDQAGNAGGNPNSNRGGATQTPGGSIGTEKAGTGGALAESRTNITPEPVQQIQYIATQNLGTQGTPVVVLPTADGFLVVYPLSTFGEGLFDDDTPAVFNSSNHLRSYGTGTLYPSGSVKTGGSITDTGSLTFSNGQVLTWGRWTGATAVITGSGTTVTGVPVLFATATGVGEDKDHDRPDFGGVATYRLSGGPKAVDFGGNLGSVTNATLKINFTTETADFAMTILFPSIGTFGAAAFDVSGVGMRTHDELTGDIAGALTGTCTGGGCATAAASGGFALGGSGPNGYDWAVVGGSLQGTRAGGVAFITVHEVTNFVPGPAPTFLSGQAAWASTTPTAGGFGIFSDWATFDSARNLTGFTNQAPCTTGNCTLSGTLGTGTLVDVNSAVLNDGSSINWGRWSGGTINDRISGTPTSITPSTGVTYVVGNYNSTLPANGSFTYTFAGGPHAVSNAGVVGNPLNQGAFTVTFGTNQTVSVSTPLTLTVGPVNYSLNTACGGVCTMTGPTNILNMSLSGTCSGGACATSAVANSNVFGTIVGTGGMGIALTGNIVSPAPTVTFGGAFKR